MSGKGLNFHLFTSFRNVLSSPPTDTQDQQRNDLFFLAISTFLFQELKSSPVEEAGQGFFLEDIKLFFFVSGMEEIKYNCKPLP